MKIPFIPYQSQSYTPFTYNSPTKQAWWNAIWIRKMAITDDDA
jgi:hypothetical protein